MQSQVPTVGGNQSVEELRRELAEAREQQAATAEILASISSSATDASQVFAKIAASAARLCDAHDALICQVDGGDLRLVAHHGPIPTSSTFHFTRELVIGRAILDRRTTHVADLQAETDEYPEGSDRARHLGHRTILAVPLIRAGEAIGAISIRRTEGRSFTDQQIDLLKTFADQAVIAIENTQLFEEVQEKNRALTGANAQLTEALEQQTATSEVLSAFSRSPGDVQPVFDTIARNAARLCEAEYCFVYRFDGQLLHFVAHDGVTREGVEAVSRAFPSQPSRGSVAGRAVLYCDVAQIPDIHADPDFALAAIARAAGYRSALGVPMMRNGFSIGAIALGRSQLGFFPARQIDLIKIFADQAVIAIENARLFEEVQARNRELRAALEQQTATSEVLRAISRAQTDAQPVFDIIAASALRLCGAGYGQVALYDGKYLHMTAFHNVNPEGVEALRRRFPAVADQRSAMGRAIQSRAVVQIPDVLADPAYAFKSELQTMGFLSLLVVPMLAKHGPIGAIAVGRAGRGSFPESQIELLKTFADQAVIAVENTRLFEELQARNRDLTALSEVGRAVSSTLDLKTVFKTIVDRAVALSDTDAGSMFYYRDETGTFELGETCGFEEQSVARIRKLDISASDTGLGEAIAKRRPVQFPDVSKAPSSPLRDAVLDLGLRAVLIVPLLGAEGPLGALVLRQRQSAEFPEAVVSLMQAFADQSAIALENARLFNEIAQKSRELEIASQHKSQFVANMSHELRTPLAAILGYAELMQEGFYEPLGQKSLDALTRIRSNGKHLLGLINTVLDIAKIESGQFTLNMAEYAIENVVETVRSATESLAQNKKLTLKTEVARSLPIGLGDEQRLTQVLLNLVGNAIKFTDTGEVRVTAKSVNGHFAVSVVDTGPGIPEHERARIFEQFHQIDNSNTKAKGGTGLGLAIAKQIVEMHGGRIWVESTLGKGSTFQMELPTRAEFRKMAP